MEIFFELKILLLTNQHITKNDMYIYLQIKVILMNLIVSDSQWCNRVKNNLFIVAGVLLVYQTSENQFVNCTDWKNEKMLLLVYTFVNFVLEFN